jgi:hypothetical protein
MKLETNMETSTSGRKPKAKAKSKALKAKKGNKKKNGLPAVSYSLEVATPGGPPIRPSSAPIAARGGPNGGSRKMSSKCSLWAAAQQKRHNTYHPHS